MRAATVNHSLTIIHGFALISQQLRRSSQRYGSLGTARCKVACFETEDVQTLTEIRLRRPGTSRRRAARHPARTDRNAFAERLDRRGPDRRHLQRRPRRATFLILSRIRIGIARKGFAMRRAFIVCFSALCTTHAFAQTFPSSAGTLSVETIARGLDHRWGLAFLPDGRMLVTERPGRLRIVTREGKLSPAIANVPQVRASGQGGLHDVVLDRDFASNRTIYFCFAEPASGGGRTAMARARLSDGETPQLDDVKVIFRQECPLSSGGHYGCRIVQGRDGHLWLTMGEHFTHRNEAQNLANHLGKIVRVTP